MKDLGKMKQTICDFIKEGWRIQTCQFEYWPHLKARYALWHLVLFVGSLLACLYCRFLCLVGVLCVISLDFLVLFDKKRRIFKDDYKIQTYEFIGTIWATLVSCVVIVGLIVFRL